MVSFVLRLLRKHWVPAVGFALLAAWFVLLRPTGLGGDATYTIVSGDSMEPGYHSGDLVILKEGEAYSAGDIVSYHVPPGEPGAGSAVIHRVISGDAVSGWRTQGDNRDRPDIWNPGLEDMIGEAWIHIPKVGAYLGYLRAPILVSVLAGGCAAYVVMVSEAKPCRGRHRRSPRVPVGSSAERG